MITETECLRLRAESAEGGWAMANVEIKRLQSENAELRKDLADEERQHIQTIKLRDLREEQVTNIYLALGGQNEWSNLHDLGEEAMELLLEMQAKLAAAEAALDEIAAGCSGDSAGFIAKRAIDAAKTGVKE